jgi:DNA-binding response OmpR family regulator
MIVLIVEDDPGSRSALERLLAHKGHSVMSTATIADAINLIKTIKFDRLLLDLMLPDGMGYELFEKGLGVPPTVFCTGTSDSTILDKAKKCSPLDILIKPLNIPLLFSYLEG